MWDNSLCELIQVELHGGTSYVLVADNKTKVHCVVSAYLTFQPLLQPQSPGTPCSSPHRTVKELSSDSSQQ